MNGLMVGADADALDAAASELQTAADQLEMSARTLSSSLGSLSWLGKVAVGFSDIWNAIHNPGMARTAGFLRQNAERLHRQAAQQRAASESDGRAAGGPAQRRGDRKIGEPLPVERPHRFGPFTWGESETPLFDYRDTPLFGGKPGEEIDPTDVRQGSIGDCYVMAAFAALAATTEGRERIRRMIADNGDGTFTVTFADGQRVTVDDSFYVDAQGRPIYAKVHGDIWPAILEEAYARRQGDYGTIGEGGNSTDVMRALGVNTSEFQTASTSDAQLTEVVLSGKPVVFSVRLNEPSGIQYAEDGGHAFSMVSAQRGADGVVMVTLRNPWGSNEGLRFPEGADVNYDTGTVTMPLSQVKSIFYRAAAGT